VRRTTVAVLLLFVLVSILFTYPLVLHLADAVEDRQDALLNVWITAWDGHQLLTAPLDLFDANIFYPYPRTLAYSELLLGNGLLALPITAATGNPVLSYNLALLLSFVLSGWGTYLLVHRLTRSPGAGLVAGTIFAFCAYRLTNLAQAQLLTTQWMPFALLAMHQLLRRPRPRHVATFVLFFCLQGLSSFYYGILLALTVALLGIGYWILGIRSPVVRPRSWVAYVLAATCCSALVILPFALPYFQVQRDLGFARSLADSEPFSASLRQYVMVPPGSVLHGRWLPSDDTPAAGGYPVDALFPGLVALALACWGLLRGKGRARWLFLVLLLASWIFSLGPRLHLAPGQPAAVEFKLPYAWLYAAVPGFQALRAPVRFDALAMLALAVLAGSGLAAILGGTARAWTAVRGPRPRLRFGWARAGVTALLAGLVLLESLVWPAGHAEHVPVGRGVPAVYDWLAREPPGPLLELPLAFTPAGPRLDYQYLSTYHWHPTPDGYSGFIPPKHGQIVYEMERFPSERSVSLLQALDVRYVVVHAGRYPPSRWLEMKQILARVDDLEQVTALGSDHVYRLRPRPFDPAGLGVSGYLPPRAVAGRPYTVYLLATNDDARSYAVPPTAVIRATVTWQRADNGTPVLVQGDVPLVTSPRGGVAMIPLPLTAPAAPGTYRLTIEERDSPLGTWAVEGTVEVGDRGDASFPVPAQLAAWHVPPAAQPGHTLSVSLAWRALGKIDAYYSVYVKLLDAENQAIAGWDGQPRNGGAPTLFWVPGETIEDVVDLMVPEDAPPGDYTLEVGMYRAEDLARCLTLDAQGTPRDRVVLGQVRIQP
jgi:hypothetical protein